MADDTPPPRAKGGRPKLPGEVTPMSAWVPKSQHARLCAIATRRHESLSAVVRRVITRGLQRS